MKRIPLLLLLVIAFTANSWGQDAQKKGKFSIGIDYVHVLKPYEWRAAEYQFLLADKVKELSLPAIYGQYIHTNDMVFQLKAHAFTQRINLNALPINGANDPNFYYEDFPLSRSAVYVDLMVGYNVLNFWKGNAINDRLTVNVMGGLRKYFFNSEYVKYDLMNSLSYCMELIDGFYSNAYTIRPVAQLTTQYKVYKNWSVTGSYNFVYNKKACNFSMLHLGVNIGL